MYAYILIYTIPTFKKYRIESLSRRAEMKRVESLVLNIESGVEKKLRYEQSIIAKTKIVQVRYINIV
jgi:hypothetical protein